MDGKPGDYRHGLDAEIRTQVASDFLDQRTLAFFEYAGRPSNSPAQKQALAPRPAVALHIQLDRADGTGVGFSRGASLPQSRPQRSSHVDSPLAAARWPLRCCAILQYLMELMQRFSYERQRSQGRGGDHPRFIGDCPSIARAHIDCVLAIAEISVCN